MYEVENVARRGVRRERARVRARETRVSVHCGVALVPCGARDRTGSRLVMVTVCRVCGAPRAALHGESCAAGLWNLRRRWSCGWRGAGPAALKWLCG